MVAGSELDNAGVRGAKVCSARGVLNGWATLSNAQVLSIFAAEGTYEEIADARGTTKSAVADIKTGRTWSWLT